MWLKPHLKLPAARATWSQSFVSNAKSLACTWECKIPEVRLVGLHTKSPDILHRAWVSRISRCVRSLRRFKEPWASSASNGRHSPASKWRARSLASSKFSFTTLRRGAEMSTAKSAARSHLQACGSIDALDLVVYRQHHLPQCGLGLGSLDLARACCRRTTSAWTPS